MEKWLNSLCYIVPERNRVSCIKRLILILYEGAFSSIRNV